MAVVVGYTAGGREVHRLAEFTPIRASVNRRTQVLGVDDDGTVEGRTQPMRTYGHDDVLAALADEGVPVAGYEDRLPSGGMLGVEVEFPSRRASGRDLTHALLEAADVPLVPRARRRGRAAEKRGMSYDASFTDAHEDQPGDLGVEDEAEEDEDGEREMYELVETATTALQALLMAWGRRRRAVGSSLGIYG